MIMILLLLVNNLFITQYKHLFLLPYALKSLKYANHVNSETKSENLNHYYILRTVNDGFGNINIDFYRTKNEHKVDVYKNKPSDKKSKNHCYIVGWPKPISQGQELFSWVVFIKSAESIFKLKPIYLLTSLFKFFYLFIIYIIS